MTISALNRVDAQAVADGHEERLATAYRTVLNSAGRTAASRFTRTAPITAAAQPDDDEDPTQPNWTAPNIDELVDLTAISAQTAAKTKPIHRAALQSVANAYGDIGINFDVTNPLALSLLAKTGGRAGDVAKSVRDDLQKIIGDAYSQGLSVEKTATQIRALSDQFSRAQSRMLARTDLNGIANGGSHLAATVAGAGFKTWLTADDDLVRPTHEDANGQTVPISEPFDVGGESADYPGDPQLSDAEAANCRCTLTYSDSGDLAASGGISTLSEGGEMSEAQITIPLNITIGQPKTPSMADALAMRNASRLRGGGITLADNGDGEWLTIHTNSDGFRLEAFGATGSTDLPLSDRDTPWDAGAARKTFQPADFPKAHFWRDPNGPADQIGSYKFPFAQRVDGTLTAIWKGVTAGAQRLSSAKGVDTGAIEGKMRAYYAKAAKQYKDPTIKAPFASSDDINGPHVYMDDGSGVCSMCGMGPGANVHSGGMTAAGEIPSFDQYAVGMKGQGFVPWTTTLCVEGIPTVDSGTKRMLALGGGTWLSPPIPIGIMYDSPHADLVAEAPICARADFIWRDGNEIKAMGIFTADDVGQKAAAYVGGEFITGISIDPVNVEWEPMMYANGAAVSLDDTTEFPSPSDPLEEYDTINVFKTYTIAGATICPVQALTDATIALLAGGDGELTNETRWVIGTDLTASAVEAEAPIRPPAAWFDDPQLDRPTLVTVTDDGRVFGHVAPWRGCHTGYAGRCVPPPRSRTGYSGFHVGRIETDDGELLPIGKLTIAAGHAGLDLNSAAARAHYDNTSKVAAFVRAGEDAHGIWVAGALRPGTSPEMIQDLLANPLSGDWRNGEMIAAHAVPVPGFPILQASAIGEDGEETTALILTSTIGMPDDEESVDFAIRSQVLAASARGVEALAVLARS